MLNRVFALCLAFVILWSGLSTVEAFDVAGPVSAEQAHVVATTGNEAAPAGSIDHHHLDDLPSQAQSEPSTETPGLLPAEFMPSTELAVMRHPHWYMLAVAGTPFLAGPLRPPCFTTHNVA